MSNILPYHHKKAIQQIRVLRLVTVTIWTLIILVITAAILLIPQLVMVNAHYAIAVDEISKLEQSGAIKPIDIMSLEKSVNTLSTKLAAPIAPAPTTYIAIVRNVSSAGISLTGFSMEGKNSNPTLTVAGTSTNREALQRFVATLESTAGVVSVDSPVSNYVKSGTSPFQLTVVFK